MKLEHTKISIRLIAAVTCLAFLASCATAPQTARGPEYAPTASLMREARSANVPVEKRAADYLQAAAMTAPLLGTGIGTPACETYNAACGEVAVLLRSSEGGRLWNQPLTLAGNNTTYHLRLEPAGSAVWAPNYFTTFESPDQIKEKLIRKQNVQEGVGGALVGVRIVNPPEKFAAGQRNHRSRSQPRSIFTQRMPRSHFGVRPSNRRRVVEGKIRPLAANFSAPISYYQPPGNLSARRIDGGIRSSHYMDKTGLYFLQPYDPDRIPVVFVHGLISTPFDWVQTINGLQADPEIRKHYQFWVFGYPTGNPILYSALRSARRTGQSRQTLSESRLRRCRSQYGRDAYSQAQVTSTNRPIGRKRLGETARSIFAKTATGWTCYPSHDFQGQPPHQARRVHLYSSSWQQNGSAGIGELAIKLISLPVDIVTTVKSEVPEATLRKINNGRLPNSVSDLDAERSRISRY